MRLVEREGTAGSLRREICLLTAATVDLRLDPEDQAVERGVPLGRGVALLELGRADELPAVGRAGADELLDQ